MKIKNKFKSLFLGLTAIVIVGCQSAAQQEPEETKDTAPTQAEAETQAEAPVAAADADYEVVRGDHLWGISGKAEIYGDPYQWPLIYKKNTDKIKDADLIYPGQVFSIDKNPSASEVSTAVNHAKTRGRWSIGVVEQSDKDYLSR